MKQNTEHQNSIRRQWRIEEFVDKQKNTNENCSGTLNTKMERAICANNMKHWTNKK